MNTKDLKEKFTKYKIIILPVLAIFICLILIVLVIFPHIFALSGTSKLLENTKNKHNALTKKLETLSQTDKTIYQDNVQATLVAMPQEKDIPGAVSQLLFLVGSSNLQLDEINLISAGLNVKPSGESESYQIGLGVTGDIDSLLGFMLKIKTIPRVMKITKLEVFGGRASNNVQATISLAVFFKAMPVNIGSIEQPIIPLTSSELERLSKIKSYKKVIPVIIPEDVTGTKGKTDPFQ